VTTKNPHTLERSAELLTMAANVRRIAFYELRQENKSPQLCCRIFTPVQQSSAHVERLAARLNEVIAPVIEEFAAKLELRALEYLEPDVAVDER